MDYDCEELRVRLLKSILKVKGCEERAFKISVMLTVFQLSFAVTAARAEKEIYF